MTRCCVLLALMAASVEAQPMTDYARYIWFDQPATNWASEALPVGNGHLGSMIFGTPAREPVAAFDAVEVYAATFRPLKYTLSGRNERTLVKLVVDAASQRVVGAHMVGPDAPEIIQGLAIAVKAGLTKEQFDATVAIHPTAAEEFVTLRDKRTVRR